MAGVSGYGMSSSSSMAPGAQAHPLLGGDPHQNRQSASAGVERKNIRVVVRVRPPIEREIKVPGRYHQVCTADSSAKSIRLCELVPDVQEGGGMIAAKEETFAYDSVHGEGESQADVYNSTGALATEALLNGYNTTILAYGQTGTGKTYTMEGFCYDSNDERRGIIARCMDTIFHTIAEYPNRKSKFALRASYLQIYNEQIWDLLKAHQPAAGAQEKGKASSSSATAAQQVAGAIPHLRERSQERGNGTWNTPGTIGESSLIIRESKKNGLYVDGLSEWVVQTQTQVYALIQRGGQARVFADTKSNEVSSRSHTVFTIMLEHSDGEPNGLGSHTHSAAAAPDASGEPQQYNPPQYNSYGVPGAQSDGGHLVPSSAVVRMAKLNLVDLAGSERVHWTGARGQQLEESKKINTSLLALGNVIQALADVSKGNATRTHIPYRDSKLTRILEDSLGGNCITTIVAMVSPAHEAYAETLSTLKFADRAKTIKTAPSLNTFAAGGAGGSQDEKIHQIRQHYEKQVAELKEQLQLSRTGSADVLGGAGRAVLSGGNGPISGGGGYAESERSGGAAGDGMGMSRDMLFSALHEEREKSRNLERRLSQFTSGISLTKGETASCGLTSTSDRQTDIAELYEEKLTQLEAERTTIKEDKSQITRYKQLLLKQRDIMRTFTQRLRERDDSIVQFQSELDQCHAHIEELKAALQLRDASYEAKELAQLRSRVGEMEEREAATCSSWASHWDTAVDKLQEIQSSETTLSAIAKVRLRNAISQMRDVGEQMKMRIPAPPPPAGAAASSFSSSSSASSSAAGGGGGPPGGGSSGPPPGPQPPNANATPALNLNMLGGGGGAGPPGSSTSFSGTHSLASTQSLLGASGSLASTAKIDLQQMHQTTGGNHVDVQLVGGAGLMRREGATTRVLEQQEVVVNNPPRLYQAEHHAAVPVTSTEGTSPEEGGAMSAHGAAPGGLPGTMPVSAAPWGNKAASGSGGSAKSVRFDAQQQQIPGHAGGGATSRSLGTTAANTNLNSKRQIDLHELLYGSSAAVAGQHHFHQSTEELRRRAHALRGSEQRGESGPSTRPQSVPPRGSYMTSPGGYNLLHGNQGPWPQHFLQQGPSPGGGGVSSAAQPEYTNASGGATGTEQMDAGKRQLHLQQQQQHEQQMYQEKLRHIQSAENLVHNPHYPQNREILLNQYQMLQMRNGRGGGNNGGAGGPVAALHNLLQKPRSRSLPGHISTRGTAIGRRRRTSRSPVSHGNHTPNSIGSWGYRGPAP